MKICAYFVLSVFSMISLGVSAGNCNGDQILVAYVDSRDVELSVSSIYNDVPVKRMHLSSMLDPFARQVFSLMWSLP